MQRITGQFLVTPE